METFAPGPRTACITGAGTGLGRATAELFAARGCTVLLVGRRPGPLEELRAAIEERGGRALVEPGDVAEPGFMDEAVERLYREAGSVEALVANAGVVVARVGALETTEEDWQTTLRVNLTGVHRSCKAALRFMVEAGGGAIVTISSISGQVAVPLRASYSASKGGVIAYTRNLAVDYARAGVRANCICPGFVETDINRDSLRALQADPGAWRIFQSRHPLGLGRPEDVARAAWFLCSGEARWITGVDLSVDGGYTAL